MAVILESERKSFKARIFLALIYSALALGAVTMAYPFAVMIAGSFSSAYDYNRQSPIVSALFSRSDRFMRSIATYFRSFPREVYPDAPDSCTTWTEVAKDKAGIKSFAESELEAYRRILTPVIRKICIAYLRGRGFGCNPAVIWDNITLQDEVELSRARLYNAQAEKLEAENKKRGE